MKQLTRLTALICLIAVKSWATTYYVTPSGSNSNNGLAATTGGGNGPWATLTYAASASVLAAGDIVYVKSGNYGSENVVFTKSGSSGSPISFIGYTSTPGDTPPVLVTSATVSTTFSNSDMPTYTGWSRSSAGTAFDLSGQKYLTIKNFQIKTYQCAVQAGGTLVQAAGHIIMDNVNTMTLGSTSVAYSGKGFQFGDISYGFSSNNTITNCLVINSTYVGFDINGDNNTVTGCKVFCNENITSLASTDFYMLFCGSYNTVKSCYVERAAGITNSGSGIGCRTNAEQVVDQGLGVSAIPAQYNTFSNCSAKNMGESFFVYFRTAQYNLFYHCDAVGTHTGTSGSSGEGGGLVIRDGASDNTFDGCKLQDCSEGIIFQDTQADGDTGGSPTGHPGNNNKIVNGFINNCYVGVSYSDYGVQSDAGDNTIANCTFYKSRYLHYAGRHCTKMKYIGNIYYGTSLAPYGGYFSGSTYASDIVPSGTYTSFKQCDFIYIEGFSGSVSSYTAVFGNISADPVFVSSSDLHLQTSSPCIDQVDAISLASNLMDYANKPRYFNGKSDIGAYEAYTGNVYYVTTSGSNSNNGLAETTGGGNGPWATLTYAASSTPNLQPGDVVYVKAGSYGNENVVFANSGTAGNPISYIGYQTTPGDAPPVLVTSATASTTFTTSDMPTYTGSSRNSGIAFDTRPKKYLVLKNFQIRTYEYGFLAGGTKVQDAGHIVLENVNTMLLGNAASSYSGKGIQFGDMGTAFSNKNTLTNCLVINACAEAIDINGNNNTLTGCKTFCNENTGSYGATDYYILICGNKNTVTSCLADRLEGISHSGHGIGAKTNAEQVIDQGLALDTIPADSNTFVNCVANNLGESFFVRHRKARYNLFYHCVANGTHTGTSDSQGEGGGLIVRDGASNNTFDGCTAVNCSNGIEFDDTTEDGDTGGSPSGHPGNNNKFVNCIINNCYIGVKYDDYGIQSDAGDNTIANCTFYKSRYLHFAGRHCANMKYIGNIYYGTSADPHGGYFSGNTYSSDIVPNNSPYTFFKQCDFYNIEGFSGGTLSSYTAVLSNISADPVFVSTSNLHLQSSSPCIDIVDGITLGFNPADFDNLARYHNSKSEIGAYEYYSGSRINEQIPATQAVDGVVIYPNPSNGTIYISAQLDASYQIHVLNMMGQVVYNAGYSSTISLTDLNSGIYFIQILSSNGDHVTYKKISIEK